MIADIATFTPSTATVGRFVASVVYGYTSAGRLVVWRQIGDGDWQRVYKRLPARHAQRKHRRLTYVHPAR